MRSKVIDKTIAVREALIRIPGRLKRSFFRAGYPATPFERAKIMTSNFFLHIHPPRVDLHSLKPTYTLGLGVIAGSLFVILCITGFLLMFYYVPAVELAYGKMQDLIFVVSFGRLVRNLHRWTSDGMVIVVFLHMCRVFYTGAYKAPREFNWLVGVALLLLTLVAAFTGYLLPWDQLSFWAVTVATDIIGYIPLLGERARFLLLGGSSVGGETLARFYAFHVALIPLALAILGSYHLWRIRKDGGLARPRGSEQEKRKKTRLSFPRLVYIELSIFLGVLIIFLIISLLFDAPLGEVANPEFSPNPAKAPWFFLGVQELVSHSAFLGGVVVPGLVILLLLLLPYLDRDPRGVGLWFARERRGLVLLWSLFVLAVLTLTLIGAYFRGPNWRFYWPWEGWPGPR